MKIKKMMLNIKFQSEESKYVHAETKKDNHFVVICNMYRMVLVWQQFLLKLNKIHITFLTISGVQSLSEMSLITNNKWIVI